MQKLTSELLKQMFLSGAHALDINKSAIDALNVFPVPDGDTGTNMSLTLNSAVKDLVNHQNISFKQLSDILTKGSLRGARGNSGVILSQIIKGMCQVIGQANDEGITTQLLANALKSGSDVAYQAVSKPQEGTILTVVRKMAEQAQALSQQTQDINEFLDHVLNAGEIALQQTPELLPVLKKAGVIDAGGRGLMVVLTAMHKSFLGQDVNFDISDISINDTKNQNQDHEFLAEFGSLEDIEFAYCTEFMVTHIASNKTNQDIESLKQGLLALGDSVVCVGDLDLVKVHVHTNEPSKALGLGLLLGELINIKIDNMKEQFRQIKSSHSEEDKKQFGMVSVCAGDGLETIFNELSVDYIVKGGQTMNPSAEDIANACKKVNANEVFVFPNNKNIILAAESAKELTDQILHIVPTKTVPEGVAAVLCFNEDATAEENMENMLTAKDSVVSASVTHAVRNTQINDLDIMKGDIIGLSNDNILTVSNSVSKTALDLIEKLYNNNYFNITVYYGSGVSEEQAEGLRVQLEFLYPDIDIILLNGGQPVYYYLISLE